MPQVLSNKIFGNAFNLIPEIGPASLGKLFTHFGSFETAWFEGSEAYIDAGLPARTISQIIAGKIKINPEQSFAELTRRQIEVITITDPDYPPLLKEISTPPALLYVRGNKKALKKA